MENGIAFVYQNNDAAASKIVYEIRPIFYLPKREIIIKK